MDEKDLGELRELVEFLKENGIAQFEMERADLKVKLKFAGAGNEAGSGAGSMDLAHLAQLVQASSGTGVGGPAPAAITPPHAAPSETSAAAEPSTPDAAAHLVKSPLVGTFYSASSPGAEPFVKVGDHVSAGQVLCIVEAMKLMNEVEADASGEVVKIFPESGQPVEYGQALFAIRA